MKKFATEIDINNKIHTFPVHLDDIDGDEEIYIIELSAKTFSELFEYWTALQLQYYTTQEWFDETHLHITAKNWKHAGKVLDEIASFFEYDVHHIVNKVEIDSSVKLAEIRLYASLHNPERRMFELETAQ